MRKFGADYSIGFKNGMDIKIYSEIPSFFKE